MNSRLEKLSANELEKQHNFLKKTLDSLLECTVLPGAPFCLKVNLFNSVKALRVHIDDVEVTLKQKIIH